MEDRKKIDIEELQIQSNINKVHDNTTKINLFKKMFSELVGQIATAVYILPKSNNQTPYCLIIRFTGYEYREKISNSVQVTTYDFNTDSLAINEKIQNANQQEILQKILSLIVSKLKMGDAKLFYRSRAV